MIAKLLFILFLAAYFTAHFGDRKGLGAEPRSQDTVQANETIEQFITYRHKQWDGLIKDAGKVKGGLLLVARVSPEQATVAEKFRLSFYIKDVTELPSRISRDRYGGTVQLVLVRDAHGKPVRLTAEGLNRINSVAAESS